MISQRLLAVAAAFAVLATPLISAQRRTPPSPSTTQKPATQAPFTTPLPLAEMSGKQAVVNTSARNDRHRPQAGSGAESRWILHEARARACVRRHDLHRVIRMAIMQGGDPLSKDPAKARLYGTGGLGVLKAELSGERATRGALAAVLQPNQPDSAGSQFFICVTDQPALDGKYTVFGRVTEGMDVAQKISEAPADAEGHPDRSRRDQRRDHPRHSASRAGAVLDRDRRRSSGNTARF